MDINFNSTVSECDSTRSSEEIGQEKVLASGIQLRTSARVSKKLRHDQEITAAAVAAASEKKCEIKTDAAEEKRKVRRPPMLWSPEDKAAFFEALNENGKNFEAIRKYMTGKAKKRGDHSAKNREQARHFYYRTWHKLSKHVKFPQNIKKVTQELYGLINFGELRKKVGKVTEKNAQKLNELIYSGSTQVRVRGKTWRIKTPVCRTLRTLNQFEENPEEVKLPSRVEVVLTARTQETHARVQALAHNPRVRTTLTLESTLDSLIDFLDHRWPSRDNEVLRVGPESGAVINQPNYRCGQVVTSNSLSLLAHEKRFEGEHHAVQALLSQLQIGKPKSVLKWQKEESAGDDYLNADIVDPAAPSTEATESTSNTDRHAETVNQTEESKEEFEARIKKGWTKDSASRLRIGELYIMLGNTGVVKLDYWWERLGPEGDAEASLSLSKALSRLLAIAKLYYVKCKVECPCGHICRTSVKPPSVQAKQTNKSTKTLPKPKEPPRLPVPSTVPLTKTELQVEGAQILKGVRPMTSMFKQPLLPAPSTQSNSVPDAYKALQQFRPKYCNRRGRARHKSVVVQRMLPLLPKAAPGLAQRSPSPVVVTLQVIPQSTTQVSGEFIRVPTSTHSGGTGGGGSGGEEVVSSGGTDLGGAGPIVPSGLVTPLAGPEEESPNPLDFLSLTMPAQPEEILPTTSSTNTFSGLLGSDPVMDGTPPTSPSRILKEGDSHWLNSEVSDFSLSSFLGHLESPLKPSMGSNGVPPSEDTRLSADVESHFQSLLMESSLDYTAKFADLAAKIAGPSNGKLS